jgi:four helix bundle protein
MKYKRFEDLPVWKAGMELGDRIARVLDRASVSVTNNIAEGFERGTTPELLSFIYYARGSAGEVRSMLYGLAKRAAADGSQISNLRSEISDLIRLSESVSRQLHGWAEHLQNSDIPGVRHLNDVTRERYERDQRKRAFIEKLEQLTPKFGDANA